MPVWRAAVTERRDPSRTGFDEVRGFLLGEEVLAPIVLTGRLPVLGWILNR